MMITTASGLDVGVVEEEGHRAHIDHPQWMDQDVSGHHRVDARLIEEATGDGVEVAVEVDVEAAL